MTSSILDAHVPAATAAAIAAAAAAAAAAVLLSLGCCPPGQGSVGVGLCLQPHQNDQRAARGVPGEYHTSW